MQNPKKQLIFALIYFVVAVIVVVAIALLLK